ncbi:hypothetical protein TNCV_338271 [Trichonephila clavipes]|nr:hypothetical protein TNCV_338271 [Trichonephila clavipes]
MTSLRSGCCACASDTEEVPRRDDDGTRSPPDIFFIFEGVRCTFVETNHYEGESPRPKKDPIHAAVETPERYKFEAIIIMLDELTSMVSYQR